MKKSIVSRHFIPFLQWYGLMILITILIDYILHRFQMVYVGRYLGVIGTLLIILSFIYSLRKRKIINSGAPGKLLIIHEYLSWIGSILVLVHAGIHYHSLLPWLATFMMLIAVASGLVGKYLLKKSAETLKAKRSDLLQSGLSAKETDKQLFFDSITLDLMKKWRLIHLPITLLFGVFSLLHIISVFLFMK